MEATQQRRYEFPVFITEGGRLVRHFRNDDYIIIEDPTESKKLGVGDLIPKHWRILPANGSAQQTVINDQ